MYKLMHKVRAYTCLCRRVAFAARRDVWRKLFSHLASRQWHDNYRDWWSPNCTWNWYHGIVLTCTRVLHRESKKGDTTLLSISLLNIDRFL